MEFSPLGLLRVLGALGFVATSPLMAAPTDLDSRFGQGGVVLLPENYRPSSWQSTTRGELYAAAEYPGNPPVLIHFDVNGSADMTFAGTGALQPHCEIDCTLQSFILMGDQRIATLHYVGYPSVSFYSGRFTAQGQPEPGYGASGIKHLTDVYRGGVGGIAAVPSGETFGIVANGLAFQVVEQILHIAANGDVAAYFGAIHEDATVKFPFQYQKLLGQPDGGLLAVTPGPENGLAISRFLNDQVDATFGINGRAVQATPGPGRSMDVTLSADGIVVAGTADVSGIAQIAVARADARGTFDVRFGTAGIALVKVAREHEAVTDVRVYVQPAEGGIMVAATIKGELAPNRPSYRIALARLRPDGTLDDRFAPGGVGEFWQQWGSWLTHLAPGPDGTILMGAEVVTGWRDQSTPRTRSAMYRLLGGALPAAIPARERQAVEYFHAGFGHYFLTADPVEIATLDMAWATEWVRSGATFNVFDLAKSSPVCRFWSGQSFAPMSTHFFSPYPYECSQLQADPRWRYEGIAFDLDLPVGAVSARDCPDSMQRIYRAFNATKGGAPNHRYMADPNLLDQMIAQGWIMEGELQTRVFACGPPPR